MAFAGFAHSTTTEQVTRSYDRWIIAGYAIVAAAAIVALYFASGGAGKRRCCSSSYGSYALSED